MTDQIGTEGDDSFASYDSVDVIQGLGGVDWWEGYYLQSTSDLSFVLDGTTGNATLSNGTTLSSVERGVLFTGSGNDIFTLTRSGYSYEINGGAGINTLVRDDSGTNTFVTSSYVYSGVREPGLQGHVLGGSFSRIDNLDLILSDDDNLFSIDLAKAGTVSVDAGLGTDMLVVDADTLEDTTFLAAADGTVTSSLGAFHGFESFDLTLGSGVVDVRTLGGNDIVRLHEFATSTVDTGGGDDRIVSGGGTDSVDGGVGEDTFALGGSQSDYSITGDGQGGFVVTGIAAGGFASATLRNVEWVEFTDGKIALSAAPGVDLAGTPGNDIMVGTASGDVLRGLGGNDTLRGKAGDDWLEGGAGHDRLNGGTGADSLFGGKGNDKYWVDSPDDAVFEAEGEGIDTVNVGYGEPPTGFDIYVLPENVENVNVLGGFTRSVWGNALDNGMAGSAAADAIDGGMGNDIVCGYGGNDRLDGGYGRDTLYGGTGDDVLSGGPGADTLHGGAGADAFYFNYLETSAERDIISVFEAGVDQIQLPRWVFSAFIDEDAGALDPGFLRLGAAAVDADDHLIYNRANGSLYYDADGVGGEQHVRIALMWNNPVLDAGDIVLI